MRALFKVFLLVILVTLIPAQLARADDSIAAATTTAVATPAAADPTMLALLQAIANSTNSILEKVNNLPDYLGVLVQMATSFITADANTMQNEQGWFASLATDLMNAETAQQSMQVALMTSFFGSTNIGSTSLPNINDLSVTSLLGNLLLNPDPRLATNKSLDPAYNYLLNASSLSSPLEIPGATWRGDVASQRNYRNFFNVISAVQSFNGYILSRFYQDSKTMTADEALRQNLVTQSSSSAWFTSVGTENLGWVLRQILIYSSQTYVYLDQLLQTQKQLLAAQAMTNSLLVMQTQQAGQLLVSRAKGLGG